MQSIMVPSIIMLAPFGLPLGYPFRLKNPSALQQFGDEQDEQHDQQNPDDSADQHPGVHSHHSIHQDAAHLSSVHPYLVGQGSLSLAPLVFRMILSPSCSGRLLPCSRVRGHFPTFFRTSAAGLGTATAMFVLVPLAFRGTRVANCGADAAELCDESGIPANECRTGPALVRAIDAKPRAFRHLAETLIAAGFTLFCTLDAGLHARLILMSHWRILLC